MSFWKMRPGQSLGQNGKSFVAGDVVEIDDHVAADSSLSGKFDPCDADGNLLAPPEADVPLDDAVLAASQPHERVSMLEADVAARKAGLLTAEVRLAHARAAMRPKPTPTPTPAPAAATVHVPAVVTPSVE